MERRRHPDHAVFIAAIHACERLRVTFFSKEDGAIIVRETAPLDYGPSRTAREKSDRYHVWNFDSDTAPHPTPLVADQIRSIEPLGKTFDPERLVTWDTRKSRWFVPRDWGHRS